MARHDDAKRWSAPTSSARWSLLEMGYATRTRNDYLRAVDRFTRWCSDHGARAATFDELDDLLADYIQSTYINREGKGRQQCVCTLSGIVLLMPRAEGKLLVSGRMLHSWRKAVPSVSYPPLTWDLTVLIAVQMIRAGHYRFAVATVLGFDCLLRINELLSLRARNFADAKDARLGSEYKLTSIEIERAKTGKEQSVDLRDDAVKSLVRALVRQTKPNELLFPGGDKKYRKLFHQCCAELGLSRSYVPHSLRHGGATRLVLLGWTIESIMARGRWVASTSCRKYLQSAKAVAIATPVPAQVHAVASVLASDLCLSFARAQSH